MIRRILMLFGIPIMITHAAYTVVGCASALREVESYSDPRDDVALSDCREVARRAKDAGADAAEAFRAYYACTEEAGLR